MPGLPPERHTTDEETDLLAAAWYRPNQRILRRFDEAGILLLTNARSAMIVAGMI
jgi:hypothetical protein